MGESGNAEKIQDKPKHLQQRVYLCVGVGRWRENEFFSVINKRLQNGSIYIWINQSNSLKAFYENLD